MRLDKTGVGRPKPADLLLVAVCRKPATRQVACCGPGRLPVADFLPDLLSRVFGKKAIGGQLTAEHVEERRPVRLIDLKDIVPGRFLGFRSAVKTGRAPDR